MLPQDVTYVEASEGGNVQSIVHGQTVIWVLEAAPKTDGEVWVTVKVTKALKGQAFANSAVLEVTDQVTGQEKKAATNQVINYVLDDVVKEVLFENGRKNLEGEKVKGGRTLLYRITFSNPATSERTFTVTDELPEVVSFVSAENDGTYESTNTITWTVTLASGKSATVSFYVTVDETADCDFIQNVAEVHVNETDADSNKVKVYVKGDKSTDPENDPEKETDPDGQDPDDDPKQEDTTPADDQKQDVTPADTPASQDDPAAPSGTEDPDDDTPADDTKKQDDSTPTDDTNKSDDSTQTDGTGTQDTDTPSADGQKDTASPTVTPADDTKKSTTDSSSDATKGSSTTTDSSTSDGKGQSTTPSDGKGQSTQTTAPQTGDEANVGLWAVLMVIAAGAACGLLGFAVTRRRKRR